MPTPWLVDEEIYRGPTGDAPAVPISRKVLFTPGEADAEPELDQVEQSPPDEQEATEKYDAAPFQATVSLQQLKAFFQDPSRDQQLSVIELCKKASATKRCSLAQQLNPTGQQVDVFVSASRTHVSYDFLAQLQWFATIAVKERLVDQPTADDVCFWIWDFSVNRYTESERFGDEVWLEETPYAVALQRSRCVLLVVDEGLTSISEPWVAYSLLAATKLQKSMHLAVWNVQVALRAPLAELTKASQVALREDFLLEFLRSFKTPDHYGELPESIVGYMKDLMLDLLAMRLAREGQCSVSHELLMLLTKHRGVLPPQTRKLADIAALYGNLEMANLVSPEVYDPVPVESVLEIGTATRMEQDELEMESPFGEILTDDEAPLERGAPPQVGIQDIPNGVPKEVIENLNIGIDFAQRLGILWSLPGVSWPNFVIDFVRWPMVLSMDLGVIFPNFAPAVRTVGCWIWPLILLFSVFLVERLHGNDGSRWDTLFLDAERWKQTRAIWMAIFVAVLYGTVIPGVAWPKYAETTVVVTAYWIIVNGFAAFVTMMGHKQAKRTVESAKRHNLDPKAMLVGFHAYMRHSLGTVLGLFFVASWLPPVRSCLNTAKDAGPDEFGLFATGLSAMLVTTGVFLFLPLLFSTFGIKTTFQGIPVACLMPLPMAGILAAATALLLGTVWFHGDKFVIFSGFLLPWNIMMPMMFIVLCLRSFRTHPFGALVAGDFKFQYHRVVSLGFRFAFAAAMTFPAMIATDGAWQWTEFIPGSVVLMFNAAYTAVAKPYSTMQGTNLDILTCFALVVMLAIPAVPESMASNVFFAVVPYVIFVFWAITLRPLKTFRALRTSPERSRAKLQATLHSPEWIYAKPLEDLRQIAQQEAIFWSVKHVNAVADRLRAVLKGPNRLVSVVVPYDVKLLLQICAAHSQDPEARLAAANAMEELGFPDEEIRTQALKVRLEHLGHQLWSTDAAIRTAAATALGCIGEPAQVHATVLAFKCRAKAEEEQVRVASARALGGIGPAAAEHTRILADLLVDGNPLVRDAAAEALGCFGESAFAQRKELAKVLPDGHPFLRICFGQSVHAKSQEDKPTGSSSSTAPFDSPKGASSSSSSSSYAPSPQKVGAGLELNDMRLDNKGSI